MIEPKQFADIFNMFHDGSIIAIKRQEDVLILTIEIEYIAELVNPQYKVFFVHLFDAKDVSLTAWYKSDSEQRKVFTELEEIAKLEPEILSAELVSKRVSISCDLHKDFTYGELTFNANSLTILDENNKEITQESFKELCESYWTNF